MLDVGVLVVLDCVTDRGKLLAHGDIAVDFGRPINVLDEDPAVEELNADGLVLGSGQLVIAGEVLKGLDCYVVG